MAIVTNGIDERLSLQDPKYYNPNGYSFGFDENGQPNPPTRTTVGQAYQNIQGLLLVGFQPICDY